MPAPEFNPQTPGDLTANTSSEAILDPVVDALMAMKPVSPTYAAKHNGGGRFVVADADGTKVGDFTGTKDEAATEAERLNAGGEPLVLDPQRVSEPKSATKSKPSSIDPATIKQPVLTDEGWLCPVPPVKE